VIARGKRLRVSVEVDCTTSSAMRVVAGELARRAVAAEAKSELWKVNGVSVVDVSDGSIIGRWADDGREFVRVAVDTGEVLP
jgi:hypothetical protein